jgi:hypothetical protein
MNATNHGAQLMANILGISTIDSALSQSLQLDANWLRALALIERMSRPVQFLPGVAG